MKFIIHDKVYNTDNMELIAEVEKYYEATDWLTVNMFGSGFMRRFKCNIFRSKKGNYLLTHEYNGYIHAEAISEKEAKNLILKSDYDIYAKLYGELEEA